VRQLKYGEIQTSRIAKSALDGIHGIEAWSRPLRYHHPVWIHGDDLAAIRNDEIRQVAPVHKNL
jgi:hypothetical protein